MKETAVGEIFEIKLKVVEQKGCKDCFFYGGYGYIDDEPICLIIEDIKCGKFERTDNKNVIFVKAKEEECYK